MHSLLVKNAASRRMDCWPQPQLICALFHMACTDRQRKCGRATKGKFSEIRDTLSSGIVGMGTAAHFASAEWRFENRFFSDLLCRWYIVCQERWTMLLRCYLCILGERCSTSHARQNPSDSLISVSDVNLNGTLECMSSPDLEKDTSN